VKSKVESRKSKAGITRRELFGAGAAVVGGLALPTLAVDAAPEPPKLPAVPRRVLGKTGESIPILLMGGAMGFDARFDPRLAEAMRFGVNYVDAADCYDGGRCETSVGAFHTRAKNRKDLWITSKSDRHNVHGFEQTLEESLKKIQTDTIDLYFLHMLTDASYLSPEMESLVKKIKKERKIRYFGFSCHGNNVVELLHKAAQTPWVDAVMFRYNFREYGNKPLNEAVDAAHKSGVGLIAMKTQGSEPAAKDAWQRFEKSGKWNKYQAVLKAVWEDQRMTAAVSHMDTFEKLRENVGAALDRTSLTSAEKAAIERYAAATRSLACDGCDHICGAAVPVNARIGDTIRGVMYHDAYGEPQRAKELLGRLPVAGGALHAVDFSRANRACPHGVDVASLMRRASEIVT
jgi:predicted aldo/keto reductase-like oxidoreductase